MPIERKISWGVPCPPEIRVLFDTLNAPVDIMLSSKGFLRADSDRIFMSDHDMPDSHSRPFCEHTLVPLETRRGILFRVYKTKKGLRTVGLRPVPAPRANSQMLFESDCDETYSLVAKESNKYSCRLTPKPVRLGLSFSIFDYRRFTENGLNSALSSFLTNYSDLCGDYAVCSYVSGPMSDDPLINAFIEFHDRVTKAHQHLPLA